MIWKKKWKLTKPEQLMKDFTLFIQKYYRIAWSVEKRQTAKTQKLQRQIKEKSWFYQNLQCVIVKNWDLWKKKE